MSQMRFVAPAFLYTVQAGVGKVYPTELAEVYDTSQQRYQRGMISTVVVFNDHWHGVDQVKYTDAVEGNHERPMVVMSKQKSEPIKTLALILSGM